GWTGDTGTGYISGICNTPGFYSYSVSVCNGYDCSAYEASVHLTGSSAVPVANAGADFTVEQNESVIIRPTFSGGAPTAWLWTNLPAGLIFDPATGVVTGRIGTVDVYTPSVSASNEFGSGPADGLTITVGAPFSDYTGDTFSLQDVFIELTTGVVSLSA